MINFVLGLLLFIVVNILFGIIHCKNVIINNSMYKCIRKKLLFIHHAYNIHDIE